MLDLHKLYPLLYYSFAYIYLVYTNAHNRYIKGNALLSYTTFCKKYDGIHDLYTLLYILNIKICTFTTKQYYNFNIYFEDELISKYILYRNNKAYLNNPVKIIQNIIFVDSLSMLNQIIVYNTGNVIHSNCIFSHIYNYKGERRNIEQLENFENINNIIYI